MRVRFYDYPSTTEIADELDNQVGAELSDKLYLLPAEEFIKNLMYENDSPDHQRDQTVANQCLKTLDKGAPHLRVPILEEMARQESVDKNGIEPFLPKYEDGAFSHISETFSQEKELYPPLITLLTYINTYFRVKLHSPGGISSVDSAWPRAVDPLLATPESTSVDSTPKAHLRRSFVITASKKANFCDAPSSSTLHPDLCLLLEPTITPPSYQPTTAPVPVPSADSTAVESGIALAAANGRVTRSQSKRQHDNSNNATTSKPQAYPTPSTHTQGGNYDEEYKSEKEKGTQTFLVPPPIGQRFPPGSEAKVYWKNVKVPIEIKLSNIFKSDNVYQMARYVRAVKLEQFDRNVVFSLMLNQVDCRIFYWDAAVCFLSEINIREEPALFIQVIGRLASMSPESLGYDLNFSNAGRVLAPETLPTILTVVSTPAPKFPEENRVVPEDQKTVLRLKLDRCLAEPRGGLFSRFPWVWKAFEVGDSDQDSWPTRVVKQNWADVTRIFEGFLYGKARGLQSVANACGSQIGEFTRSHRDQVLHHIQGVYRSSKDQSSTNKRGNTQSDRITSNSTSHWSSGTNKTALNSNASKRGRKAFKLDKSCKAVMPNVVDRAIVRIVFTDEGGSLWKIDSPRQLLLATKNWVTGIKELRDRKITHRDISTGNLLISENAGQPAFLIDLGLAHYEEEEAEEEEEDPQLSPPEADEPVQEAWISSQNLPHDQEANVAETLAGDDLDAQRSVKLQGSGKHGGAQGCGKEKEPDREPKNHHHLTGTLPFISYAILRANSFGGSIPWTYHHDLESIFWVLVYICLRGSDDVYSCEKRDCLDSSNLHTVLGCKGELLTHRLQPTKFSPTFQPLEPFLQELSSCFPQTECPPVEFETVFNIIDHALQQLEEESSSNQPSESGTDAMVPALEVPLEPQEENARSASTEHKSLARRASKRKLSELAAASETITDAQPQDDDVRELSRRGGSRRRVV